MNLETRPTVDALRELIEAANDREGHHILWVTKDGDVHLSVLSQSQSAVGFQAEHPEMQLRLETFEAGNDYVGQAAARDDQWMNELFDALTKEWSKARGKEEVQYADQF